MDLTDFVARCDDRPERRAERRAWRALRAIRSALPDALAPEATAPLLAALGPVVAALHDLGRQRARPDSRGSPLPNRAAVAELLRQAGLPRAVRRQLAELVYDLLALESQVAARGAPARAQGGEHARVGALAEAPARVIAIPSSTLFYLRRHIFPSERMFVGAVRNTGEGGALEAVYDVTGLATAGHVVADPAKLTHAFLDMDASGTYFGVWAHSHPGGAPAATFPSAEDQDTYRDRVESGAARHLIGAIFAGKYLRFFRAADRVRLVGPGLEPLGEQGNVYAFP